MWGAHKADGRIAAKNAVKIRAALRNAIDSKRVYEGYQATQPIVTKNRAQDRARARAWVILNIRINNEALKSALLQLYAEAWATGQKVAEEEISIAQAEAKKGADLTKADDIATVDWSKWQPGDAASALLIKPPKAFQDLLTRSGKLITGLDKTGYEIIGNALADTIELGLSPRKAAKLINEAVGNPARALTIAVTESSRVMNASAMNRYKDAGLTQNQWMPVLSVTGGGQACEKCAENTGQIVNIGDSFRSGNTQPPAHPHCRCNLKPVVPNYDDMFDANGNLLPIQPNEHGVSNIMPKLPQKMYGKINRDELLKAARLNKEAFYSQSGMPLLGSQTLTAAYEVKGYNKLPQVIPTVEFNQIKKTADVTVYRGISGNQEKRSWDFADEYLTGNHYAGYGVYGNGTYSSTVLARARDYAQNGIGEGTILEMLIKDKSNFITASEIRKLRKEFETDLRVDLKALSSARFEANVAGDTLLAEKLSKEMSDLELAQNFVTDDGVFATMTDYDGIELPVSEDNEEKEFFYVILNRGKMIVKGTE